MPARPKKSASETDLPPLRRFGSIQTAAELLECSTRHIRDMIARGELTGYRLGSKVIRVDLDQLADTLTVIPTGGRLAAYRGAGDAE